ncbi:phospholipase ABHD3-like [Camellia sinensis]|uniref:phospholipase ABHD3-like n=1 Tax=Camellia sinensis TaxID=4442 RepID=UPI0010355B14|nr:phospholipase ABHD3-like [Camellia sinensis]
MDSSTSITTSDSPYRLLLTAASLIPISHYLLGFLFICLVYLYNFLEIHFLGDLFTGFTGQPVSLIFNSCSDVYQEVVSKCPILHGRYLSTPWLSSPHLQTFFLSFFGQPPTFNYRRQLFHLSDGGTMALDWLMNSNGCKPTNISCQKGSQIDTLKPHNGKPQLHFIAWFTNHSEPLFTLIYEITMKKLQSELETKENSIYAFEEELNESISNNKSLEKRQFSVKYLGEDDVKTPIAGAAAVCSPWDLLICDRFINRRMAQKFYDKVLTIGLKGYAQLHQTVISRLADWEGIEKSRSVRDFDNYATRVLGKYETVDTYYRHNSSTNFVGNVMVPLLCISTLDDPVCTREAIPWDECRANKNIVLATTHHGGHLAFYEGIAAKSLWWVRAVHEFFSILHSSSLIHRKEAEMQIPPQESSIDQGPYVNITEDGMVTALGNEQTSVEDVHDEPTIQSEKVKDATPKRTCLADAPPQPPGQDINDVVIPVRRYMDQLSRHSRKSIWLLAYIAIITTWPLVGSALTLFLRKKFANLLPAVLRRR